ELDRAPVEVEGQLGLTDVLEADSEVVGVIGVGALEMMGLKVGELGGGPLALVGVEIAEREIEVRRGVARDQLLQPRLCSRRIGAAEQRDQPALRQRMARLQFQDLQIESRRLAGIALPYRDRGETEEGIRIPGLGGENSLVEAPGRIELVGLQCRV